MKKIKYIIVIFLIMILKTNKINAETLSDISIRFDEGNLVENSYMDSYVYITSNNFEENEYRVLITKDNQNISNSIVNPDDVGLIYIFKDENSNKNYILGSQYMKYASMYGDTYFTLYEYDGNTFNKVSDSILFERPEKLLYTNRIVMQFYVDKSVNIRVNDIYNEESIIKFKIGEVTDTDLLKKLDGTSNSAYEELLNYAKNDNNPNQINKFNINNKSNIVDILGEYDNLYDPSKIKDASYYYGYFEIDTENGKYYPLEDIALYKAESNGSLYHTNYRYDINDDNTENDVTDAPSSNDSPNNDKNNDTQTNEPTTNDNNIENPKTGTIEYIVIVIMLINLLIIIYYGIKKYDKRKKLRSI